MEYTIGKLEKAGKGALTKGESRESINRNVPLTPASGSRIGGC